MSTIAGVRREDPPVGNTDLGMEVRGAGNFHVLPTGGIIPVDTLLADLALAAGVAQVINIAFDGGREAFFYFENVGANPLTYSIVRTWVNGALTSVEKEEPPETDPALTRTLAAAAKGDWHVADVRANGLRVTFLSAAGSTVRWTHREE